jgi:hypothetical protein
VLHGIHALFRRQSLAVRVTFVKRNKSNQKCWVVVRWCIALRVPSAFFEIILRRAASDAHPWAAEAHAPSLALRPDYGGFQKTIHTLCWRVGMVLVVRSLFFRIGGGGA